MALQAPAIMMVCSMQDDAFVSVSFCVSVSMGLFCVVVSCWEVSCDRVDNFIIVVLYVLFVFINSTVVQL